MPQHPPDAAHRRGAGSPRGVGHWRRWAEGIEASERAQLFGASGTGGEMVLDLRTRVASERPVLVGEQLRGSRVMGAEGQVDLGLRAHLGGALRAARVMLDELR